MSLILLFVFLSRGESVFGTKDSGTLCKKFILNQMEMAFIDRICVLRKVSDQKGEEAEFSCVSFHPIYFKADSVFFFLWSGLRGILNDKRAPDSSFVVPLAEKRKSSVPKWPASGYISSGTFNLFHLTHIFSSKKHPWVISLIRCKKALCRPRLLHHIFALWLNR